MPVHMSMPTGFTESHKLVNPRFSYASSASADAMFDTFAFASRERKSVKKTKHGRFSLSNSSSACRSGYSLPEPIHLSNVVERSLTRASIFSRSFRVFLYRKSLEYS